jgi:hypothetical protein
MRKTKKTINIPSLRILLALVIVLIEVVFINSLASAGMEFILSSDHRAPDSVAIRRSRDRRVSGGYGRFHFQLAISRFVAQGPAD